MTTKLITDHPTWNPVKIELEFTTREELAVFVALMGSANATADTCLESVQNMIGEHVTRQQLTRSIDAMIDFATWKKLKEIVKK